MKNKKQARMVNMLQEVKNYYYFLLLLASACFISTILIGIILGLVHALPDRLYDVFSVRLLRPLHTFFTLAWIFLGFSAVLGLYCKDQKKNDIPLVQLQCVSYIIFLIGTTLSISMGYLSGREYLGWPMWLSIPLLIAFIATAVHTSFAWEKIKNHSGDAAWLIMLGLILLPLGLIESYFYLFQDIAVDIGRDLTIQWHALDTVIAAWCVVLYGIGILLLPEGTKGPRAPWLFALATIGILLDFGHHNYVSPQPHYIKIISFCATMLAITSFLRHLHSYRKLSLEKTSVSCLLNHAELWTLFAVGTGILMAIPHINYYIHGTYGVVGHTMGSIIGVNSFLICAAGFSFSAKESKLRRHIISIASALLFLFCLVLIGLGIARGMLRADKEYIYWAPQLRPWYMLIPIFSLPLSVALLYLGGDLVRCCISKLKRK